MLTVLIPTKNRPYVVANQIKYLDSAKFPFHVIYVDASNDDLFSKLSNYLNQADLNVSVEHHKAIKVDSDFVASRSYQQTREGLKLVRTPYVVFAGDDDYHHPDGLMELVSALDAEPDASTCGGMGVVLTTFREQGSEGFKMLPGKSPTPLVGAADPFFRVQQHLATYSASYFNVRRTDLSLQAMEAVSNWEIPGGMTEVLESLSLAALGKFLRIPKWFLTRHIHHRSASSTTTSGFDLLHPQFQENYFKFEDELFSVLHRLGITVPNGGRRDIQEAFKYFIIQKNQKYNHLPGEYQTETPDYGRFVRQFADESGVAGSIAKMMMDHAVTNYRYFLGDPESTSGDDFWLRKKNPPK